jgi:hypothetical protein
MHPAHMSARRITGSLSSLLLRTISSEMPRTRNALVSSAAFFRSIPSTMTRALYGGLAAALIAPSSGVCRRQWLLRPYAPPRR